MLSIRFLLGAAVGAAAGYGVARALEAKASGHSLQWAFSMDNLFTPVAKLRTSPKTPVVVLPDVIIPGPSADPWSNLTPQQKTNLDVFSAKYPGLTPSMRPVANLGSLGAYPYPSMPMWANGQVDIRRNLRRYR